MSTLTRFLAPPLPLDDIDADGGYSTRKIRNAYSGPCLRVRRASDNAEADIAFNGVGDLDTAALLSHCGGSSGFVSVFYDQSGAGKDLSQSTAGNQPKIVNSGAVEVENGRPCVRFYGLSPGANNSLFRPASVAVTGCILAVCKFGSDAFFLGHSSLYNWHSEPPAKMFSSAYASNGVKNSNCFLGGNSYAGLALPYITSLGAVVVNLAQTNGNDWNNIGTDRGNIHNVVSPGCFSELIHFSANLARDRTRLWEVYAAAYFGCAMV
jgi:hypothetical protein